MPAKKPSKTTKPVETTADVTFKRERKLAESKLSQEEACQLDLMINDRMRALYDQTAKTYLEIAEDLKRMKDEKGYLPLGFKNWEAYKTSKEQFGRTYLTYLVRLSEAGDLRDYLDQGVAASKFIEFAKHAKKPEQIPELLKATWDEVKDLSVRKTGEVLRRYVDEHPDQFMGREGKVGGRPKQAAEDRIRKQFEKVPASEREAYLAAMRKFLEGQE